MAKQKRIMMIDGHAMAFRAYHALPPMTGPQGEPTNAVLGYANMLLKAIADYEPDYVVAAFDVGVTFRHKEYAEYKATRAQTPDDLSPQFGMIQELTEALGIPIYRVENYEADDVLGTLSHLADKQGLEAIIVTGDSDTFQLISDNVKVLVPARSFGQVQLYDVAAIKERYGLAPGQLIDHKALTGDSSDNIPGVRGVGDKTATTLMQTYGSLEAIYEHVDEVKQTRFRQALIEGRESAFFSKHLVTIVCDMDLTLDLKGARWGDYDREGVMELLRRLGFHSLVSRLPGGAPTGAAQQLGLFGAPEASSHAEADQVGDYQLVNTTAALTALTKRLAKVKRLAIDTETTSTDAINTDLVGISLAAESGQAYYLPVGHDERMAKAPQLALADVQQALAPILADAAVAKIMHNAKFDLLVLHQHGLLVAGPLIDTMLAAWLLSPSGRGIGLKEQVWQRLGVEMTEISELIGTGRKQISMDLVAIAKAAPYACADADMTLRLAELLLPELAEKELTSLFDDIEMPLVPVLQRMEEYGMLVDPRKLEEMSRDMTAELERLTERIHALAGHDFNIKSTQQLGGVLFDELGLPAVRRTKTGYSTAADVLEELHGQHEIIPLIESHRQLEKIKGTYVDALPSLINRKTGRVHTSFSQIAASTGRLSSSDPNLQNIPVRSELGREVRAAFVAPKGKRLLGCDYSQVELRLLAHISKDPEMLAAFNRDEDVHATTAAAIFGVALDQVSYEQRSLAKAINFGLMYGMSAYGLAARTNLDRNQAQAFIETYFGRFSRVKQYLDETIRLAHEQGYVETLLGRRRYFPELTHGSHANANVQAAAERAAVNMPIQGTAADIIKMAMIRLDAELTDSPWDAHMILQIHDELVIEVAESDLAPVQEAVVRIMSQAYPLTIPLKVDVAVGQNWMEMK